MKRTLLIALLATLAASCGSTPTNPTILTEDFSGVLTVGSTDLHSFTVATDGTVQVTLTALSPQSTIQVGVGVGQVVSGNCTLFTGETDAKIGSTLAGGVGAGTYCVAVYDVGNIVGSNTYTVEVVHP